MKLAADVIASVGPHHLRRRWLGITAMLGVAVFVGGAFAIPSVVMKRHEDVLARRGQRTTGVVLSSSDRFRWFPDVAEVSYTVEGRQYVANPDGKRPR